MRKLCLVVLMVLGVSCGGANETADTNDGMRAGEGHEHGAGAPPSLAGAPQVRVVADDYAFALTGSNHTEDVRVVVEQPSNLVLVNKGKEEHEFRVTELGFTLHAQPGATAAGGMENLQPGTYKVVCSVRDHEARGMVATLVIR